MVLPKPEPTLKEIVDGVYATKEEVVAVKFDLDNVRSQAESIIEIVARLELATERLERATKDIKEKTAGLPKEFMRAGSTYRIR